MKKSQKDGYIVGAGFIFIGTIILVTAFDQGIFSGGKITGIFGLFIALIGAGSFIFPSVAETLIHWAKMQRESEGTSQHQKNSTNSHQINSQGNVNVTQHIYERK